MNLLAGDLIASGSSYRPRRTALTLQNMLGESTVDRVVMHRQDRLSR